VNTSSRRSEFSIIAQSLILLIALSFVIWIPLRAAVILQHPEATAWATSGKAIDTSKLEEYEKAKERAFLLSVGIALVISQSAIWLVILTRKDDETPPPGPRNASG
jgi:hypothetical protein